MLAAVRCSVRFSQDRSGLRSHTSVQSSSDGRGPKEKDVLVSTKITQLEVRVGDTQQVAEEINLNKCKGRDSLGYLKSANQYVDWVHL